jgi:hypothetical protein
MINRLEIEKRACLFFSTNPNALKAKDKKRPEVHYRFIVWRALFEILHIPLASIGRMYGRDHTTVISGIRRAKSDPVISEGYLRFSEYLVEKVGKVGDNLSKSSLSKKVIKSCS